MLEKIFYFNSNFPFWLALFIAVIIVSVLHKILGKILRNKPPVYTTIGWIIMILAIIYKIFYAWFLSRHIDDIFPILIIRPDALFVAALYGYIIITRNKPARKIK